MDDIKQLKSVLRSLVVSSPVQMTLAMLLRDYRNMMGMHLPVQKYGYRDPLQFLKERCEDCFLFQGFGTNTVLTPIVPECLKHIDEFVHKQKVSSKAKFKGKRRSVHESAVSPAPNLIVKTFEATSKSQTELHTPVRNKQTTEPLRRRPQTTRYDDTQQTNKVQPLIDTNVHSYNKYQSSYNLNDHDENRQQDSALPSMEAYKNFRKKRFLVYDSTQELDHDSDSGKFTSESGQRTLSSGSSSKAARLEELKAELIQIVEDSPDGVCCTDLMKLYRERFGRELNFGRFGFSSVSVLACSLAGVRLARDPAAGSVLLRAPSPAAPAAAAPAALPRPPPARRPPPPARAPSSAASRADDDDALPWIDFDPDVFPPDCMSFSESIPSPALDDVTAGAMLEVMVGEVYSPSHFWFYRLGERHNIAMEDMMDEMTRYYSRGEGAARALALGAVRAGHYCSSVYERDWHRSLIVKVVDSDTVKVRHVDYGTVDRVSARTLRPLLRRWGALPAQAVRARLAGARPAARGRRWPHAAAAAFLRLVQDRRLVANVVQRDPHENIVEVFLVDTSTERDVRIDLELIRAGHADPRPDPPADALAESYLYPRFDALESGDTPNFADIHAYLRDGIALEYVEDYSRHVPAALPAPAPPAPAPAPPAPAPPAPARVPLVPRSYADVKSALVAPVERRSAAPAAPTTPASPAADRLDDAETDSLDSSYESVPRGDSPRVESASPEAVEESHVERPDVTPSPARSRVDLSSEKNSHVYTPAPRAAPSPAPRLPRHFPPVMPHPPFPAPPMPAMPFVLPPPGPPFPPYPPHPMQPYPLHPYRSPPQRCYQPMRPPFPSGPIYSSPPFSSGLVYCPGPTYSSPTSHSPVPLTKASCSYVSTPILSAPTSVSVASTPTGPMQALPIAPKLVPTQAVKASVTRLPASASPPRPPSPPAPAPAAQHASPPCPLSPPPPYNGAGGGGGGSRRITTGHGEVTLSVTECEIFTLLSSVDSNAAHWYIVDAISRARAAARAPPPPPPPPPAAGAPPPSRLNPEASEFRQLPAPSLRPPPGFGN